MVSYLFPVYGTNYYFLFTFFKTPIEIKNEENLIIHVVRENDGNKVWYEWNFEVAGGNKNELGNNQIHNLGGSSYSIML